ncbi:hypothetical protein D3C81_1365630 [compost metagenome]
MTDSSPSRPKVRLPLILKNEVEAFPRPPRPMASSAINTGKPTTIKQIIKRRKKAAPPFCPVIYGNFHMLPRPTALPIAASIKPDEENRSP